MYVYKFLRDVIFNSQLIMHPQNFHSQNFIGKIWLVSNRKQDTLAQLSLTLVNVTGYSKTDHNVTFGQLLFIGSANSHTHTLPMHCCITGLS